MLRIVSGGQTGVDRAALDVAMALGLPVGGWCPAGRWAEDGPIAVRYPLRETPSPDTRERTQWNVCDADGTLLITADEPSPGTALTLAFARRVGRPVYLWTVTAPPDPDAFRRWLKLSDVEALNVAGPRESESPGIYDAARTLLQTLLTAAIPAGEHR
jgi:hypothetical protein